MEGIESRDFKDSICNCANRKLIKLMVDVLTIIYVGINV